MKTPTEILLDAYRDGVFPMAESADDDSFAFYRPYKRGLLPIKTLHIPRTLQKVLRAGQYKVTINKSFKDIIDGCAKATPKRTKTWINKPIRNLFVDLHHDGHAHSVEVWSIDGALMGGLYGLSIGAVFCGESMVSFQTNGSKIALVYLCALLDECGYTVLDAQFSNDHLKQFGIYEMDQEDYEDMIKVEMGRCVKPLMSMTPDLALLEGYLKRRP